MALSPVLVVTTIVVAVTTPAWTLPKIPRCKMTDPMLPTCLLHATDVLKPHLSKGIPAKNIPPIEPLVIPMLMLQQGTSAVNYKADLKHMKVMGLKDYKFRNVALNLPKLTAAARVEIPAIMLESDYVIKGRALVLPIEGDGKFFANLTDIRVDVMIAGTLKKKKKGEDILQLKTVKSNLIVGKASAHFDNLFNGDKTLSQVTNNFVNQNAADIIEEIKPAVEAVISMIIEDIGNKVLLTVPYNELFLPEN